MNEHLCARVRMRYGVPVIWTCSSTSDEQQFTFSSGRIRSVSDDTCLDVQGPNDQQYTSGEGAPTVGADVNGFSCNSSMNQKWNLHRSIRYAGSTGRCLDRASSGDFNGANLQLWNCNGTDAQQWDYYF